MVATRGRLFRSPLLTIGDLAAPGVACEWTIDLAPVEDREVVPGQRVELHATIDAVAGEPAPGAPIAFDVLPADTAGETTGAPIARLAADGAPARPGTPAEPRTVTRRELAATEDIAAARNAFAAEHPSDLDTQMLVAREPGPPARTHVITWWPVTATAAPALNFTSDIAGVAPARSARAMRVSRTAGAPGAVEFELRFEDGGPMPGAELEAAFEGGVRSRVTTDSSGRARVAVPPGASPVFRVFLLSYTEAAGGAPGPGPEPGPEPIVPTTGDTRPEVVAAFAFDSSFPSPAVHASLLRVRVKAHESPDSKVVVFGHTDQVGTDAYNATLSQRRAQAVLALLRDDKAMFDSVAATEGWGLREHQSMLRGIGCNPGAVDGNAGAMTRTATTNFQREYNVGVYHERAAVERARPTLAVDGNPGPATQAAIRDAYVAVAPHVASDRFADPQFEGCGESHPISTSDDDNRRAVVAFLAPDLDLSQSSLCARYEELIGETPEDRRAPHFSDHQWLREEDGALHLSSVTVVKDGTPARIRVVRAEQPVPIPVPDSSTDGPTPPPLGPTLQDVPAEIKGGIAAGRWTNPDADVMDPATWVVDHDVELEIREPGDNAAPGASDPASGTALLATTAMRPPVFIVEAGSAWGLAAPPGHRLNRVRFDDDATDDGVAVRSDGIIVRFGQAIGRPETHEELDVLSLALGTRSVPDQQPGVA